MRFYEFEAKKLLAKQGVRLPAGGAAATVSEYDLLREVGLAVEIDGPIHSVSREADNERQRYLERSGIRFVRLPAELVERDPAAALALIRDSLLPSLAPAGEGPGVRA